MTALLTSLLTMLSLVSPVAHAEEPATCEPLVAVPGVYQVAWISPVRKRVRSGSELHVVRVGDLRAWINQHGADQTRMLQGMGFVGPAGGRKAKKEWKITIFDIESGQVCRPVEDATAGADLLGAQVCSESIVNGLNRWESECGYTVDRAGDDERGLDIFHVTWEQAASQGFCVMPLERFLEGA